MSVSIHFDIGNAYQTLLKAVVFPGLSKESILVRKKVQVTELAALRGKLPSIQIVPVLSLGRKPSSFEGGNENKYSHEISVVAINPQDAVTNMEKYQGWLELARRTILKEDNGDDRTTLTAVPCVWNLEEADATSFDPATQSNLYDNLRLVVTATTYETTN